MGDRVEVRDLNTKSWEKGTVKELVEGRPKVQADGEDESYLCYHVQPLVFAQFYSHVSCISHFHDTSF